MFVSIRGILLDQEIRDDGFYWHIFFNRACELSFDPLLQIYVQYIPKIYILDVDNKTSYRHKKKNVLLIQFQEITRTILKKGYEATSFVLCLANVLKEYYIEC